MGTAAIALPSLNSGQTFVAKLNRPRSRWVHFGNTSRMPARDNTCDRVSVSKKIDCVAMLDMLLLSAPRKLLIKQIGRAVIACHLNRGTG
jgi:hypothetical protein